MLPDLEAGRSMGVEGLLQAPRAFARVCPSSSRDGRADVEESAARRRHTCPQDAFDVGTGGWAIAPCLGLFPGSVSVAAFFDRKAERDRQKQYRLEVQRSPCRGAETAGQPEYSRLMPIDGRNGPLTFQVRPLCSAASESYTGRTRVPSLNTFPVSGG